MDLYLSGNDLTQVNAVTTSHPDQLSLQSLWGQYTRTALAGKEKAGMVHSVSG